MNIKTRLSIMMFLQYFVWGAWYVTMGTYLFQTLKFEGAQIGLAYGATAIAAMISPFFMGYFADRYFATERMLGFLHILGAILVFWVSGIVQFSSFYMGLILYTLAYMPTLALSNALTFAHINDPAKDFPSIRVLGTIGWIVAGLLVGYLKVEASAIPFQLAAGASLLLGLYCFTLPHTPPKGADIAQCKKTTISDVLGLEALSLFKDRNFSILVLSSFLVSIPLFFYFSFSNAFLNEINVENAAGKMTIGQMSEIIFMLAMPLFFKNLGVKKMILVGILAWVARYILFAMGDNQTAVWMLYLGIFLHGICYDFFFVTGQIYVDEKSPNHIRAAAQGLITFATYGIGNFIGTYLAGKIVDAYAVQGSGHLWSNIWLVPAAMAAVVFVIFALFFKDKN
jgi:nucleoside transporter